MKVEIERRPSGQFARRHNWGKGNVQVIPDFVMEMGGDLTEVIFVEAPGKWTKCEVRLRYDSGGWNHKTEEWEKNPRTVRGRGISRLHEDDTWDRKTGRMIAFGKAMADLFSLSLPKLFREGTA